MDDVLQDLAVREFAERTDLYGTAGTFDHPPGALTSLAMLPPPRDRSPIVCYGAGA